MRRRVGWWAPGVLLAVVLVLVVLFLVVVRFHPGGVKAGRAVDDVGQLLAAAAAAAACGRRARRAWCAGSRAGRPWLLLALATGSWAGGELAWSYFELLAGRQTPFPSVADAGYLLFAVLAVAGMLLWPSHALRGGARWRGLLDGVLVAGSLFTITWVSALGSVVHAGGDSRFAFGVSLAYPVTDLVLLTLTVVVVAHARQASRSGLGLLAAGLGLLCLADSGFAYLTAAGSYATGSPVDAGWFGGFLLIAAAACTASTPGAEQVDEARAMESTTAALLPYLPAGLAVAVAVAVGDQLTGHGDPVALLAATLVMAALLARQLLAVLDNRRLVVALVDTQQALRFQAFHDPLTGLANRALFADRLRHGLELHRRDLRPLSLLYCDLDGFKTVNDTLGHDAGDGVIRAAAERLRAVTRPGDTVARMGGDEFAILVEDGGDAMSVVAKILDGFTQPAAVGRDLVPLAASIGVVELSAGAPSPQPAEFLRRADAAMYHAKRTGKARAVTWTEQLRPAEAAAAGAAAAPATAHLPA
jgi:diguanylate cyclase (GGDEF)-like protein